MIVPDVHPGSTAFLFLAVITWIIGWLEMSHVKARLYSLSVIIR